MKTLLHLEKPLSEEDKRAILFAVTPLGNDIVSFVKRAQALKEVRRKKLYREEHTSFDEWCQRELDLPFKLALALIEASDKICEAMPELKEWVSKH